MWFGESVVLVLNMDWYLFYFRERNDSFDVKRVCKILFVIGYKKVMVW